MGVWEGFDCINSFKVTHTFGHIKTGSQFTHMHT